MIILSREREVWIQDTLKRAQDRYGYTNQLMVAIEELCELSSVIVGRSHQDAVIDELADVWIVMNHIQAIFDLGVHPYDIPDCSLEPVDISCITDLAQVLCKYPRYDCRDTAIRELRNAVGARAILVASYMKHIEHIKGVHTNELSARIIKKVDRVERWLNSDKTFEVSTVDREVTRVESK